MSQAVRNKPSLGSRILKFFRAVTDGELKLLENLRILQALLTAAPELARKLLDLIPEINKLILKYESEIPGKGNGLTRRDNLIADLTELHGDGLKAVAGMTSWVAAAQLLINVLVWVLNIANLLPKNQES